MRKPKKAAPAPQAPETDPQPAGAQAPADDAAGDAPASPTDPVHADVPGQKPGGGVYGDAPGNDDADQAVVPAAAGSAGEPGAAAPDGEPGERPADDERVQHATDDVNEEAARESAGKPFPVATMMQDDRNLSGALVAAANAYTFHAATPHPMGFFAVADITFDELVNPSPHLRELGTFVRANPDAKPETIVIHLRRKGFRDTPEIAGNTAFEAAWRIFSDTLRHLDQATRTEAERAAALEASQAQPARPAALPHQLTENPLKRHPLTQQGRMLARGHKG